jgi:hypothetical protein
MVGKACLYKCRAHCAHYPNNARIIMKYDSFHSMNPSYGRERKISKSTQYFHAMHNFLSDINANNHLSKDNSYVSFSNTSTNAKI